TPLPDALRGLRPDWPEAFEVRHEEPGKVVVRAVLSRRRNHVTPFDPPMGAQIHAARFRPFHQAFVRMRTWPAAADGPQADSGESCSRPSSVGAISGAVTG